MTTDLAPVGTDTLAPLTIAEVERLEQLEQTVGRGIQTFLEVGTALAEIRDDRLYRAGHRTFEGYCQRRWGISRPRAYQLMEAAGTVSTIVDTGLPAPSNEGQARELARVPQDHRHDVWRQTLERTNGKPTAAAVREIAQTAPPVVADAVAEAVAEHEAEQAEKLERRERIDALNAELGYVPDPAAEAERDRRTALLYPLFDAIKTLAAMPDAQDIPALIEDYQKFRLEPLPAALEWLTTFAQAWGDDQ